MSGDDIAGGVSLSVLLHLSVSRLWQRGGQVWVCPAPWMMSRSSTYFLLMSFITEDEAFLSDGSSLILQVNA